MMMMIKLINVKFHLGITNFDLHILNRTTGIFHFFGISVT